MTTSAELVPDPVSHISISGVHGRQALEERLANAEPQALRTSGSLAPLVVGALIGATLWYLVSRSVRDDGY